ncbi:MULTISPECIES: DinB family protein [unclassified Marinobacter]|uniref:DinB family protein n=1 Tax=unclassified Marinobacter TaxID=83889 RepID=UPI0019294003|nr:MULTISPECIES: DinB family protein [unclassified Marinobacter]MBL3826213.1 damage-inducible protein DinB [Marinobacter sp. MC3]MBL3894719.1 damage-inducible protein DinB [Marinobacter sp. MW3]
MMQLDISSYAITMANYNKWMNENIYSSVTKLDDNAIKRDRDLFFGSIYRTLNHLLVCDLIWLARFKGESVEFQSITQELFSDFEEMKNFRSETDLQIISWAHTLSSISLPLRLRYKSLGSKSDRDVDFFKAIFHFFNHQTHHRGQLTAALSEEKVNYGVTDLIFMPEGI